VLLILSPRGHHELLQGHLTLRPHLSFSSRQLCLKPAALFKVLDRRLHSLRFFQSAYPHLQAVCIASVGLGMIPQPETTASPAPFFPLTLRRLHGKCSFHWRANCRRDSASSRTLKLAEINSWLERSKTPATKNRNNTFLSLWYREGIEKGKISVKPAELVRRKKYPTGRARSREHEYLLLCKIISKRFPEHLNEFIVSLASPHRELPRLRQAKASGT
jgi:hypothetical protein